LTRGRPLSIGLLLIAVVIWGASYVVTKSGVSEMPPMVFALLRYCVASLLLVPLALARGGLAKLPRPVPWKTLLLMALTGVAVYYIFFNLALTYTTASQGALIQSSFPAVMAIMAVLWLNERLDRRRILAIVLTIAGVILIVARTESDASARNPLLGSALAFASVLLWSTYTMLAKRIADADPIAVTAVVAVLGTLMLIPAAVVENATGPLPSISVEGWIKIAYVGVFASAVSYLLYNRALRDIDASLAGTFINLSPVIGVIGGVVFLGESITPLAILGGAMVLGGVLISSARSASASHPIPRANMRTRPEP
jgi:drug/metabolite transporter (DMT)-like permease